MNPKLAKAAMADRRYKPEAFEYIFNAVIKIVDEAEKERESAGLSPAHRHICGQELCRGLAAVLVKDFGVMAINVLKFWGLGCTADFGNVVYGLIAVKLLSASPDDSIDDFNEVYSFADAFTSPPADKSRLMPLPPVTLL